MPLVDINDSTSVRDRNRDSILRTSRASELESTKPLLGTDMTDSAPSSSQIATAVRYVNIQPGVERAFLTMPGSDSDINSIPMNERKSSLSTSKNLNNLPLL